MIDLCWIAFTVNIIILTIYAEITNHKIKQLRYRVAFLEGFTGVAEVNKNCVKHILDK